MKKKSYIYYSIQHQFFSIMIIISKKERNNKLKRKKREEMDKRVIGVLGGGQLGRMMMEPANNLNIKVNILDAFDAPATQVQVSDHVVGDFKDEAKIAELAKKCDVLTMEIEHVNCDALERIAKKNPKIDIQPTPQTVRIIQDKFNQKEHLKQFNIPLPEYKSVSDKQSILDVAANDGFGFPMMLKSRKLAYDGRGNMVIHNAGEIEAAIQALNPDNKSDSLYVEKWVPYQKELAVMVARSKSGEVVSYDVVETIQKDNICHIVFAPAQIDGLVQKKAKEIAEKSIACLYGAGIFGVEMFYLENGDILVNEIAPRPHNSGHYTIEACETSQFEQHIRAILDMPLGSTRMKVGAAAMVNILGTGNGAEGLIDTLRPCQEAMTIPAASVHLYGKRECRKGRKMGHITVTASTMPEVVEKVEKILNQMPNGKKYNFNISPIVALIMGSDSDLPTMKPCAQILKDFDVPFELSIVSAHRTPERMVEYAKNAHKRGIKLIIAAAGGAAHLPGMVAAITPLPVIGVPVALRVLDGVDSLYSIVQMPRGVPVATVAINNSTNAALLAVRMLGSSIPKYLNKMVEYQTNMREEVYAKVDKLDTVGWENYQK